MRQKFFITPFAATGDRESPPDPQQPDGSVSYSVGFGPDYEADPASNPNAKPVPREETNGIFHDVTEAVSALQREGAPEFISADDNGGTAFAYSRGAMVRWSSSGNPPFTTYVSRVNNNTAVPSNTTNWAPLLFEAATNAQAIAGTSTTLLITPASLAAALNSASVTVPDATTSVKGVQRNATNAEAQAGTLGNATVTPASLSSALGAYSFNASQVASGTLAAARIPSLPASRISSGTLAVARIPDLNASKITDGVFDAARIPAINIAASQVTSGTLAVARIPDLNAGQITDGVFAAARIPAINISAGQVTSGTLAVARIPNLDAGKVTSGVLSTARIPDLNASKITGGVFAAARIPDLDAGKVTSGVFAAARIPALAISKITGLQNALDGKASLGGNTYSGAQEIIASSVADLQFLISNSSGSQQMAIQVTAAAAYLWASESPVRIRPNGLSSSAGQLEVATDGNVSVSGSVTASGGFQGSSRTVKTDEAGCPYGLDEVLALEPVSFRYLPEYRDDGDRRSLGFFAEDLERVIPEMVRDSDGPSPKVVEYDQLLPVLVRAIQEQAETITTLEERIARLEARNV